MQPVRLLRNPMALGLIALALVTMVCLVAAYVYIRPPGQTSVVFYTDDAASIHPADQVRIAGIPVGKVKEMSLDVDRVRVTARVDDSAFVGNKSEIQVRMLTVVGGYYVNLVSLGDRPLGEDVIPLERVTMPYSLIRTMNDATKLTDDIATKPINESLNQIQQGLEGSNVDTLNSVVDAGNALMSTVDRQRGQITSIMNITDEYVGELSNYRGRLNELVRKLAIVQGILDLYSRGFASAIKGLGDAITGLGAVGQFYDRHRDDFIEKVRTYIAKAEMFIQRNGILVRGLRDIQNHIERVIDVDQSPPQILATDLCVPMPGVPC